MPMIRSLSALFSFLLSLTLAGAPSFATDQAQVSPIQLVRATVANEVAAGDTNGPKHMFRDRKQTPKGSQTRLYVETREAMAGMTIAYDDKPLNAKQLQDEQGRLAWLVSNPEQLKRKQKEQKEDADRTLRIVKALPDAFVFQYDGTVPGTASIGRQGAQMVRLKFHPNPSYHPPTHVEDVLVGMSGIVLIDPVERRIAQIDGTLFQSVNFGWGIFGHLDKGGHFLVDQIDVGGNCWEVSRMSLSFSGKILLFKNLSIKSDEVFSNFRQVPNNTTFAQGVKLLQDEETRFAQGRAETANAEKPAN